MSISGNNTFTVAYNWALSGKQWLYNGKLNFGVQTSSMIANSLLPDTPNPNFPQIGNQFNIGQPETLPASSFWLLARSHM